MKNWASNIIRNSSVKASAKHYSNTNSGFDTWGGDAINPSQGMGNSGSTDTFMLGFGPDYYLTPDRTKYNRYRYWYEKNSFVQRVIDLKVNIIASKANIAPATSDLSPDIANKSHKYFDWLLKKVRFVSLFPSVVFEHFLQGEVYLCIERDDNGDFTGWTLMPPEQVEYAFDSEWGEHALWFYPNKSSMYDYSVGGAIGGKDYNYDYSIAPEFMKYNTGKPLKFRTHYMEGIEAFVVCLFRRRSNLQNPTSILAPLESTLMWQERRRRSRWMMIERFPTPLHLMSVPGGSVDDMDDLRSQWDMAQMNPDPAIIANYEIGLQTINPSERTMPDTGEDEMAKQYLMMGLGVPESLLTGEAVYSGQRQTLELMSSEYKMQSVLLMELFNQEIFEPIAMEHLFVDSNGAVHDTLEFNRVDLKDSTDHFTQMYDLHDKGLISSGELLRSLGIDPKVMRKELMSEFLSPIDGQFGNIKGILAELIGSKLGENEEVTSMFMNKTGLKDTLASQQEWDMPKKPEKIKTISDDSYDDIGNLDSEFSGVENTQSAESLNNVYKEKIIPVSHIVTKGE